MPAKFRTTVALAALLLPQLWLVARAQSRPDRAFGFSMFPESSWVQYALFWRTPDGSELALKNGCFPEGPCLSELTRREDLLRFEQPFVAPYGQRAVLARVQIAMRALADRVPAHGGTLVLRATHATNLHAEAHTEILVPLEP